MCTRVDEADSSPGCHAGPPTSGTGLVRCGVMSAGGGATPAWRRRRWRSVSGLRPHGSERHRSCRAIDVSSARIGMNQNRRSGWCMAPASGVPGCWASAGAMHTSPSRSLALSSRRLHAGDVSVDEARGTVAGVVRKACRRRSCTSRSRVQIVIEDLHRPPCSGMGRKRAGNREIDVPDWRCSPASGRDRGNCHRAQRCGDGNRFSQLRGV